MVESTRVTTSTPESPDVPARNGFTTYFVLSPVTGLFCHRRQRIRVLSKPGRADSTSANLTPASGRQDHTILPYAATSLVRVLLTAHKSLRTRPAIPSRAKRCRVHRIPPRVRDDRDTPLLWGGTGKVVEVIWGERKRKYFCKQGWTAQIRLRSHNKSPRLAHPSRAFDCAHDPATVGCPVNWVAPSSSAFLGDRLSPARRCLCFRRARFSPVRLKTPA